jgi:peptidoglycan/xylan/chitin deacetylase (PgdA/CDA1 family)
MEEMVNSGLIEIFPHSHTHPKLDIILPELAEKEIKISSQTLDSQLGKKMSVFAYPYGRYNKEVIEILRNQGFEAAFTVKTGRVHCGDNLFLLRRNSIDSKVSFAMFKGIVKSGRL